MTVDELAVLRRLRQQPARRVAGSRRRPPPPQPEPGDVGVIVEDLRRIKGMTEEVLAEALALGDGDVIAGVGALVLYVADVVAIAERVEGGEE